MSSESIAAIKESLPPASDYLTYLTILESHLSPEILPTLNEILQDAELTQNIGWDLIHLLLPLPGAEQCLTTIARLGNPREVVLKVTEAIQLLQLEEIEEEAEEGVKKEKPAEPTPVNRFCILVNLLSILHPRIKTKFPSRFLSSSLMAILAAYRPSNQATLAVISFVHTISGKKRPSLPGRKSSLSISAILSDTQSGPSAPDPEAQEEDPNESGIQTKLLQSFVTFVLEEYINANTLEWATRLLEHFQPSKVIPVKKSVGESFREDPPLATRDTIAGQLVALSRDLGLSEHAILLETIHKPEPPPSAEDNPEEDNYPSSPVDIPLSRAGCLFLVSSFVFSSILFESTLPLPELTIFPSHAKLVAQFIGTNGPPSIGEEETGVIDSILALGLWLENSNKFVSGPLEDQDFLEYLQALSLLSANTPSPTLRYAAHVLASSVLHAHPMDRLRLTFITDTLENCPYDTLKASAVSWLKEEMITSLSRASENVFSTTLALAAAQPYMFPDTSALLQANNDELIQEIRQSFPFHMAVVNFLYFVEGKSYKHLVPSGMEAVVEEIYLGPLERSLRPAKGVLEGDESGIDGEQIARDGMFELELLGQRIELARDCMGL